MPKIEKFSAVGMFDPPTYSQGIKVTEASTVLFLAGQVAYDKDGSVKHAGDFKAQAREVFRCIKSLVEAAGGRVAVVPGSKRLLKVTDPADLELVASLLAG